MKKKDDLPLLHELWQLSVDLSGFNKQAAMVPYASANGPEACPLAGVLCFLLLTGVGWFLDLKGSERLCKLSS